MNFWFESCPPCVAEFDALNKLFKSYKNNPAVRFLSFTFDDAVSARQTIKKYGIEYPVIYLPREEIYKLIFNLGFPTTLLTDNKRKIRFIKCGGPISDEIGDAIETKLTEEIQLLLDAK